MKVRIKGSNSDYEYSAEGGVAPVGALQARMAADKELDPTLEPLPDLFLDIFICPYGMPSRIEEPLPGGKPFCLGTDETCPSPDGTSGHALIELHQNEGIALKTDEGNQLKVGQDGIISLSPAERADVIGNFAVINTPEKGQPELFLVERSGAIKLRPVTRTEVESRLVVDGPTELNGDLTVTPAGNREVALQVTASAEEITIRANGAAISINRAGSLSLTPRAGGRVSINGDLEVSGDISVRPAGDAGIRSLQNEIAALKKALAALVGNDD